MNTERLADKIEPRATAMRRWLEDKKLYRLPADAPAEHLRTSRFLGKLARNALAKIGGRIAYHR